jgi:hypothetical protein
MASGVFVEQKLPGAKHTLAFCSRWSQKEIQNTIKMQCMKPEEKKKRKAGRPAKNIKKEINASVRFSRTDYFIVKEKAATCGVSVSNYIRQAAIYLKITPRLTDEERHFRRQLIGMANNMNQMAKACHQEGLFEAMVLFENYRQQLIEVLKKLKS